MTKKHHLTDRQQAFLEVLLAHWRREGRPPSTRELQDVLNLRSPRSVTQYLDALERAGFIARGEGARNIRLLRTPPPDLPDHAQTVPVPIVGTAPCGAPVMAEQNIETYVSVSTRIARPPHHYFILRADGTSMNNAGIHDRDYVLIRQQQWADDGHIVAALIDDEVTIKRLRLFRNHAMLEPDSTESHHKPIILEREFQVQGIVKGIVNL